MIAAQENAPGCATAALTKPGVRLVSTGPQAWTFTLAQHDGWSGSAWQTESGWLCLRAKPIRHLAANGEARWSWLQLNAGFTGGAKILLDDKEEVAVGCEAPAGPDPAAGIDGLLRGVLRAMDALEGGSPAARAPWSAATATPAALEHVAALCTDAGWACTFRANGTELAITLDVPGDFCQVAVTAHDGQVILFVALLALDPCPSSAAGLEAVSGLLLRVTAGTPLVRAVARDGGTSSVGIESVVAEPFSQEGLHQALCALSVLCQHTRKEVRALYEDPAVAEAYLACQQRTPGRRIVHLTAA